MLLDNVTLQILRFRRRGASHLTAVMHEEANNGRYTTDDRDYDIMLARELRKAADYWFLEAAGRTGFNPLL